MTLAISFAEGAHELEGLREILREYLTWDIDQLRAVSGIDVGAEAYIENTFKEIELYFPSRSRLLLVREAEALVGMGFLKPIQKDACEVKRMYLRPSHRGQGLGKKILAHLIDEAKEIAPRPFFGAPAVRAFRHSHTSGLVTPV